MGEKSYYKYLWIFQTVWRSVVAVDLDRCCVQFSFDCEYATIGRIQLSKNSDYRCVCRSCSIGVYINCRLQISYTKMVHCHMVYPPPYLFSLCFLATQFSERRRTAFFIGLQGFCVSIYRNAYVRISLNLSLLYHRASTT